MIPGSDTISPVSDTIWHSQVTNGNSRRNYAHPIRFSAIIIIIFCDTMRLCEMKTVANVAQFESRQQKTGTEFHPYRLALLQLFQKIQRSLHFYFASCA